MKYTFICHDDESITRDTQVSIEGAQTVDSVMEAFLDFLKGTGFSEETINDYLEQFVWDVLDGKMNKKHQTYQTPEIGNIPDLDWLAEEWVVNQKGYEGMMKDAKEGMV